MNTGHAPVMSPPLVTKSLDAAKEVARHALPLPDGIRFSPGVTRQDWTEKLVAEIRGIDHAFTHQGGGMSVNLQGIRLDTRDGGAPPLDNTMLMFCSSMLAGNHDANRLPVVLLGGAGGRLKGGRVLDYQEKSERQM